VLSAYGENNVASMGWTGLDWTNAIIGKLAKDGYPTYFVPFFFSDPVEEIPGYASPVEVAAQYTNLVNGLFCFTAAGLPSQLALANSNYTAVVHSAGKLEMAGLEPTYWGMNQYSLARRYYETDGGEGLITQWQNIIATQPDWVEICTWNDFNESTYISPVVNPETYFAQLQIPHRNSHQGYLEFSKRYISWFKTGQEPPITQDGLFYFYRTQPMNAVASDTNDVWVYWRTGDIADQIYVTTVLTAPAQVEISSGNLTTTNRVPAGVNCFRTLFAPGSQIFVLQRNGAQVLTSQGPDILGQITNYDFFTASGDSYGISPPVHLQINN
jgi:glucan endo-1,3-alpha-glucosidase